MNKYLHSIRKGSTNQTLEQLKTARLALLPTGDIVAIAAIDKQIKDMEKKAGVPASSMTSPGACFTKDSVVLTPSGYREIQSLKEGDTVESFDMGKVQRETVRKVVCHGLSTVHDFEFSNGRTISSTDHHTVLTANGWKKFGDVKVDDVLVIFNDETRKEESVSLVRKSNRRVETVYNIHTTGPHNFVVNGIVAHNFTFARRLRSFYHSTMEKFSVFPVRKTEVVF